MSPCRHVNLGNGVTAIICGGRQKRTPCKFCQANGRGFVPSTKLCDFPVAAGKTCDAAMCDQHATAVGVDLDYCPVHKGQQPQQAAMFQEGK